MTTYPYPGIDAHVNSLLQTPGASDQPALWHSFYHDHIAFLTAHLNSLIRPNYLARSEQSLQTRGYDMGGDVEIFSPIPDVTVFKPTSGSPSSHTATLTPTWRVSLREAMALVPQPRAVLIYQTLDQSKTGRVVARIELLSPTNKPGGRHGQSYAVKRMTALETGIPLVEIDYLHETPSLSPKSERYPTMKGSYPYTILVSDPRPDWGTGEIQAFSFRVSEPIALFPLPLDKDESIAVNLNGVYRQTLEAGAWTDSVDYMQPPERFETYSAEDQLFIHKIIDKMKSVS
ncbi:MAG: DUF4058 family protein [Chloroflexota bacterium]|nr:DUF4058 family protein [Chloroflexota bacterium]